MNSITIKESKTVPDSLYIADGTRGENIPKSWVDAIFQHKLSEIGLYWVEKEKTFVVTKSIVQLDGERLHQEIKAPLYAGASWSCLDFSNTSESEAVKIYYDTLPREPKYGETWRILISQEYSCATSSQGCADGCPPCGPARTSSPPQETCQPPPSRRMWRTSASGLPILRGRGGHEEAVQLPGVSDRP